MGRSDDRGPARGASWKAAALLGCLLTALSAGAQAQEPPPSDQGQGPGRALADLPLEELLSVEVTLATRHVQRLFDVASAVYVITAEDLRRSGATSLPEALRMVPGLHVARSGSSIWAISARGFNDEFANKLLVLIDGRIVYTPLFAGVYWDTQDLLLEDVERIEVIRGPGAALWGANAVNGVINVVTRRPRDSQGALVALGAGSSDRALVGARYGGAAGGSARYRLSARYAERSAFADAAGRDAADAWDMARADAAFEWTGSRDRLALDASLYRGTIGSTTTRGSRLPPFSVTTAERFRAEGGHVLGSFDRRFSERSELRARAYYDRTERGDALETRDTVDFELQHTLEAGRHRATWGLGYRGSRDTIGASAVTSFTPRRRALAVWSGFAQDEIELGGDVVVIAGAKVEHNDFTGLELQPSLRASWFPTRSQVVWGAVSRAVRTPSRAESDIRHTAAVVETAGALGEVVIAGDPAGRAEELLACELGYRVQAAGGVSLDLALFYNDYDRLRSLEPEAPAAAGFEGDTPVLLLPQRIANGLVGRTWGAELAANWLLTRRLRLAGAWTYLGVDTRRAPGGRSATPDAIEGDSPRHQLQLRALADLPRGLELDASLYHSGRLANRGVPAWTRLDLMLGLRPRPALELRLGVQNLLDAGHLEFDRNVGGRLATEIPRAVVARAALRF